MTLLFLCLKVFLARILDVSLGSVRTILIVKGKKIQAALVGLIEISIWFSVVKEALNTPESSVWLVVAYACGFSTGVLVGGYISEKFIKGKLAVQVITSKDGDELVLALREKGFAVSVIPCRGQDTEKEMLFIEIDKKKYNLLQRTIKKYDEQAFVVVNETKYVENGYFK